MARFTKPENVDVPAEDVTVVQVPKAPRKVSPTAALGKAIKDIEKHLDKLDKLDEKASIIAKARADVLAAHNAAVRVRNEVAESLGLHVEKDDPEPDVPDGNEDPDPTPDPITHRDTGV